MVVLLASFFITMFFQPRFKILKLHLPKQMVTCMKLKVKSKESSFISILGNLSVTRYG